MIRHTFISEAHQQEKHPDGSGETAIWTDGLMVSNLDARDDNFTGIFLKAGRKYRVTVEIEELEGENANAV